MVYVLPILLQPFLYEIEDPILEVHADVGLIVDERQRNTVHESRDDNRQDYSIIIESA